MSKQELIGSILAAFGFSMLSFGFYGFGFTAGILSGFFLIPYFYTKNMIPLLTLQGYFAIMNVIGLGRALL